MSAARLGLLRQVDADLLNRLAVHHPLIHCQFFMNPAFPSGRSPRPRVTDMRAAPYAMGHTRSILRSRIADEAKNNGSVPIQLQVVDLDA